MMKKFCLLIIFVICFSPIFAQEVRDKGVFQEYKNPYRESVTDEIKKFESKPEPKKMRFWMDLTGKDFPKSVDEFKKVWYNTPVCQGDTGTCWCFSTTSFFESEIYRLTGKKLELSIMYTVYWETVEKARRFIQERGNSLFDEGSESDAVIRMWKKYGIVPMSAYPGKKTGQKYHDHTAMFNEMKGYLDSVKRDNSWNEEQVLSTIKDIMKHYMGEVPEYVVIEDKKMTPKEYLASLNINLDDYLNLMSLMQQPYYKMVEYKVDDNWWHSESYLNVPLEDFMWVMKNAVRSGFSLCIGGDTSEAGYNAQAQVIMVPTFDIPSEYIDEYSRQFRFTNKSTTDDHGLHCVGWMEKNGKDWYLIKDSSSTNGHPSGNLFFHEDYIKLKMMNIMVHKDAAPKVVEMFKEKNK